MEELGDKETPTDLLALFVSLDVAGVSVDEFKAAFKTDSKEGVNDDINS